MPLNPERSSNYSTMLVSKIRNNINHVGTSIGTSISTTVGSGIKKTFHKSKDADDELIREYHHDIERAMKALKYILKQIHRLANTGLPRIFKSNMKSVELFSKLIGANSLHFKGIDECYHTFDKLQAESETPLVHPKEKQFEVDAVNEQLYNYVVTMDTLASKVLDDWDMFYNENRLRIVEMHKYLKDTQKLINKRNKKQYVYQKTHLKLEKLAKKTSPLTDKEQGQMITLEKDIRTQKYVYEKLDERLKTILPHIFSLLEEFVDTLGKILLCKQLETFQTIHKSLDYFTQYYGLQSQEEKTDEGSYHTVIDAWESAMTPVRLQIETFITIIHNKNPELIDQEIDDEDKTLKTTKMWNKMTKKMTEHTFTLKSKDAQHGLFNGYLIADQLEAFLEYYSDKVSNTPPSNQYHVDLTKAAEPKKAPPPLPPRQNTARSINYFPASPRVGKPISLPASPVASPFVNHHAFESVDSVVGLDTESEDSSIMSEKDDGSDDDDMYSMSNAPSISTTRLLGDDSALKGKNPQLIKIYNAAKNSIKEGPVTVPKSELADLLKVEDTAKASSMTVKLEGLCDFFDKVTKLENSVETRVVVAQHDFEGLDPGDLSFKTGDELQILFDLYNFNTPSEDHWMVASSHDRIGFVPSNYI